MEIVVNAKFHPGRLVATPGALDALTRSGQTPDFFLGKHLAGDWGEVDDEDAAANEQALQDGSRILSVYRTLRGVRLYIITEASDEQGRREATTILLPEEH